jgi:transcriptional regulator with XRE-family HTH domain
MTKTIHHGRNLKRIREIMGVKQEALAVMLGDDWHQKKVSNLEAREVIEPELIEQLAKALKVPAEAIKNSTEENVIYNIQNNYDNAKPNVVNFPQQCTFNPLDKYVEAVEENKKLQEKNEKLYEQLLKGEREKIALLERMLSERK